MIKQFLAAICAVALLVLGTVTSEAQSTGSRAWSLAPLTLMEGPGFEYQVVGQIDAQIPIYVDRCSREWCRVHKGHEAGWTSLYAIDFGDGPDSKYKFPSWGFKWIRPGIVCLYEGHNFTGKSLCEDTGFKARDLMLIGADNVFSSVRIEGNASVLLCRDRDFHSYCVHIDKSQKRLHGFLDNGVSSVRIY